MTAIPMRVIPARTVLYQAPDTAFRGGRTPRGKKIRDFSAEWVSMDLVRAGGSLIRLIEPDAWQGVDVEFDAAGNFAGSYVNFQEPVRRTTLGFDTTDLVLDLVVAADRTWSLKDQDDFDRAVSAGQCSRNRRAGSRRSGADDRRGRGRRSAVSEKHWLTWRPPPHWTIPALPSNWAACD
jgi:hypothetical protein